MQKNLIKKPTCFKNPDIPKVIDLLLTNRHRSFCNSDALETGLSDNHILTSTVLKTYFIFTRIFQAKSFVPI